MPKRKTISSQAFLKNVKDTITFYDMLEKGDKVLAAVSGGPDSVCLLDVLSRVKRKFGVEIIVANMDHGLRGKESEADSDFVKKLAEKMELKVFHKKIALKKMKRKGLSIEELARGERYKFFRECAESEKCTAIATGHNIDDQAETVLMRIINGSALKGLSGIPPVRSEGKIKIVRPLIRCERTDIMNYIKKNRLKYVVDSSNKSLKYLRNNIRLEVLPFLEKYNPRLKRSLSNMSDALREDFAFIKEEKEKVLLKFKKQDGENKFTVKIKDIALLSKTLRKEVIKEMFERSGGNVKKLTYRHWMDMDYFIRISESGKSLDLPGVVLLKTGKELIFKNSR